MSLSFMNSSSHRLSIVREGDLVASTYGEQDASLHRAEVLAVREDGVELFFLDYGDGDIKLVTDLLRLKSTYLSLPYQAVHCSLARIGPRGDKWADEAVHMFEGLVGSASEVVVWASLVGWEVVDEELLPSISLKSKGGRDVAGELVRKGHAVWL